jgi:hypothetical protein
MSCPCREENIRATRRIWSRSVSRAEWGVSAGSGSVISISASMTTADFDGHHR